MSSGNTWHGIFTGKMLSRDGLNKQVYDICVLTGPFWRCSGLSFMVVSLSACHPRTGIQSHLLVTQQDTGGRPAPLSQAQVSPSLPPPVGSPTMRAERQYVHLGKQRAANGLRSQRECSEDERENLHIAAATVKQPEHVARSEESSAPVPRAGGRRWLGKANALRVPSSGPSEQVPPSLSVSEGQRQRTD